MKRFLVMMLCAAFCLTAAASVSAAIPTVSEDDKVDIMVIAREDFDEMTTETMNRSGSAAAVNASGGFASLDNLDSSIENGALKVNLSKAFFDFQFENVGTFPKVSEDAIFSMKVMPTSDNFSTSNLLVWGRNGNFEDIHSKVVNRHLIVDDQDVAELPLNEYSLLEWAFHYDTTAKSFTSVDVMLNGATVASYRCAKTHSKIGFFRVMRYGTGSCMVDDVTIAFGTTSILYAKNAEVTYSPEARPPQIGECLIPNVPEDEKIWMDIVTQIDFNDMGTPNKELTIKKITENKGFIAMEGLDCEIVGGELVCKSSADAPAAYIDLQFYQVEDFPRVKEDVIFSMKIKPLSTNFSAANFVTYRFHTLDWDKGHSSISSNMLKINGKEIAELPYGVFSLVEFVFHYNGTMHDKVDVLLNGKIVASYAPNSDATVARVDHIRLFQDFNGQFAVDDFVLAKGTTSLAYYSPNGKVPEVNNNPEDNQKPDNTVTTTPAEETTTAPVDTTEVTVATDEATTETEENAGGFMSGCGSTVAFAGVSALVSVMGVALMKKREERE